MPRKKHKKVKRSPKLDMGNDLQLIHEECINMLVEAARVNKVFKEPGIQDKVTDFKIFTRTAETLLDHLLAAKKSLDDIFNESAKLKITGNSTDAFMNAAIIGEKYKNWMLTYMDEIVPLIDILNQQCDTEVSKDGCGD